MFAKCNCKIILLRKAKRDQLPLGPFLRPRGPSTLYRLPSRVVRPTFYQYKGSRRWPILSYSLDPLCIGSRRHPATTPIRLADWRTFISWRREWIIVELCFAQMRVFSCNSSYQPRDTRFLIICASYINNSSVQKSADVLVPFLLKRSCRWRPVVPFCSIVHPALRVADADSHIFLEERVGHFGALKLVLPISGSSPPHDNRFSKGCVTCSNNNSV